MKVNKLAMGLFIFSAIAFGLYPLMYYITDMLIQYGLLSQKPEVIVHNRLWRTLFNVHIIMGGIALLSGWSQFLKGFRSRNLGLHRLLGAIYLIAVLASGLSGLYIAFYAEGGWFSQLGFIGLAAGWLITSSFAYATIKKGKVTAHQKWMVRSFALTFAAVTLRIWLPLLQYGIGLEFLKAYVIIAWLCWVPNLLWAEWKVRRLAI